MFEVVRTRTGISLALQGFSRRNGSAVIRTQFARNDKKPKQRDTIHINNTLRSREWVRARSASPKRESIHKESIYLLCFWYIYFHTFGAYRECGILPARRFSKSFVQTSRSVQSINPSGKQVREFATRDFIGAKLLVCARVCSLLRVTQYTAFGGMRTQAHRKYYLYKLYLKFEPRQKENHKLYVRWVRSCAEHNKKR